MNNPINTPENPEGTNNESNQQPLDSKKNDGKKKSDGKGPSTEEQTNEQNNPNQKNNNEVKNNKVEIQKHKKEDQTKDIKIIDISVLAQVQPKGLNNIGATCYMNSVLQCFYHVPDLTSILLGCQKIIDEKTMPMSYAFLDVINNLVYNQNYSISPYKFKEIISLNETFRGIEANDSKNLCLYFMDTVNGEFTKNNVIIDNEKIKNKIRSLKEEELENTVKNFNTNYTSIISDLFYGLKGTSYECITCHDKSSNFQIFNILNMSIERTFYELLKKNKNRMQKKISIEDCLESEQSIKYFKGDNQLFCNKCNKLSDEKYFNKIYIAPKIMILFLDRGINNSFIMCDVEFPEKLSFQNYEKNSDGNYNLIGVIEHLGPSSMAGHFIANCKHFDGKWYIFSDNNVREYGNAYKSYGLPYLLFYRRNN